MAYKKVTRQIAIEGKVYPRGHHDFSDAMMKHPHYLFFEKGGAITDVDKPKVAPQMTPEQKAKHEEMVAKYLPPRVQAPVDPSKVADEAKAPEAPKDEAPVDDDAADEAAPASDEAPKKQHPKKGK